jgi:hypothetical protein
MPPVTTAAVVRYPPEPVTLNETLGLFRSLLVIVIVPLNGPAARGATGPSRRGSSDL